MRAQLQEPIAYAHMRMVMATVLPSPFQPAPARGYVLKWRSFNEGTLERDSDVRPVAEQITLEQELKELAKHADGPGVVYPIMYGMVLFYGDHHAYVRTTWATGIPRGEDLYFVRE